MKLALLIMNRLRYASCRMKVFFQHGLVESSFACDFLGSGGKTVVIQLETNVLRGFECAGTIWLDKVWLKA